ncbi:MAG: tryptophan synthase beta chain, partial [Baekduia sp.]|nr:tryptophan synthase beta chain [Baekduia sp.]
SHALYHALHAPAESELDVICLSGRGDKDLAQIIARDGAD